MRIAVDGRAMGLLVGKGVYAKSVAQAWVTVGTEHQFTIYGYQPAPGEDWPANFRFVPLGSAIQRVQAFRTLTEDVLFSPASYLTTIVSNRPTLTTIHDLVLYKMPVKLPLKTRLAERFMLGSAVKRSIQLTVQNQATFDDLVELFPAAAAKTAIVMPGITPGVSRDILPTADRQRQIRSELGLEDYLLFVGTLEPRKNVTRLVEAYQQLPLALRNRYQLVLAGKLGWADGPLQAIAARPPAGVIVTGRVSEEVLTTLYANARAIVYPSLYEGVGYPVLEGYYWGKPVLTSNRSSMKEIGAAALLVDPESTAAISEGLAELLTDPALAAALAKRGETESQRYSWPKAAERYLEILTSLA